MTPFARAIVGAIHKQRLFAELQALHLEYQSELSPDDMVLYEGAVGTQSQIVNRCTIAIDALSQAWQTAVIEFQIDRTTLQSHTPQFQAFSASVAGHQVDQAVTIAQQLGYRLPIPTARAGWRALTRLGGTVGMTHTNADTTRLLLSWQGHASWLNKILPGRLRPTIMDAERADWPATLWPGVLAVRPIRKLLQRLKKRQTTSYGEWLGTPSALLPGLLEFATLTPADTLVDLGCGDGRVLIEAASRYGCKAQGIEQDAELCALGRAEIQRRALADLVDLQQGDARDFRFDHATVIFLFIPVQHLQSLFPRLWNAVQPGARIVVHEQKPLPELPPPNQSAPLIANGAVTVAHLWKK